MMATLLFNELSSSLSFLPSALFIDPLQNSMIKSIVNDVCDLKYNHIFRKLIKLIKKSDSQF